MLRDRPRQNAYREAIEQNKYQFAGKVVLDVGAGTGILSLLCAKAGAKKVFAVEATPKLANLATEIVNENNFNDIIQVVCSKIEDFELPTDIKHVDIIISEWMGFYLLHEGMLDSVIFARDKFLKPDGLMFPSTATINLAPCSVPARFSDWDLVDGVKMSSFGLAIRKQKSHKPEILALKQSDLLSDGVVVAWFDLKEITADSLEKIEFKEVVVVQYPGNYEGVCIWFDCEFPLNKDGESVVLSTSPKEPETHWKQTVVILPGIATDYMEIKTPIAFSLEIVRNLENRRRYNMSMTLLENDAIEHAIPCDCIMTKCILVRTHIDKLAMEADSGEDDVDDANKMN